MPTNIIFMVSACPFSLCFASFQAVGLLALMPVLS